MKITKDLVLKHLDTVSKLAALRYFPSNGQGAIALTETAILICRKESEIEPLIDEMLSRLDECPVPMQMREFYAEFEIPWDDLPENKDYRTSLRAAIGGTDVGKA